MKLDIDPRLPISDDIKSLKTRLHDLFKNHALAINAILFQSHTGTTLANYADDAAAAAGGISIGEFYRTASAVKQRVA